jgi:hypothetical protein
MKTVDVCITLQVDVLYHRVGKLTMNEFNMIRLLQECTSTQRESIVGCKDLHDTGAVLRKIYSYENGREDPFATDTEFRSISYKDVGAKPYYHIIWMDK